MGYLLMVVMIGLLVLFHEAGHLVAAKWIGIRVARFSIGFGHRLWGFRRNGTEYWISAIPIGGYVLPDVEGDDLPQSVSLRHRILFALGGPLANILLAYLVLVLMSVTRAEISLTTVFWIPLVELSAISRLVLQAILKLMQDPTQMSSVVGIVTTGGRYAGTNLLRIAEFSVFLNVSLAVFNLFPLPPLDGGKVLMWALGKIHHSARRVRTPLTIAGWGILICLILYATVLDLWRMAAGAVAC